MARKKRISGHRSDTIHGYSRTGANHAFLGNLRVGVRVNLLIALAFGALAALGGSYLAGERRLDAPLELSMERDAEAASRRQARAERVAATEVEDLIESIGEIGRRLARSAEIVGVVATDAEGAKQKVQGLADDVAKIGALNRRARRSNN